MILCIAQVLTADELETIRAGLRQAAFVDGRQTAGWHARQVKRNAQTAPDDPRTAALRPLVAAALQRNALLQIAARPRALRPVLFSRYEPGMEYGAHVDDAVMGGARPLRSDLSLTLFLSDPADYDGGELIVETTAGEDSFRLEAGSMVVYPSSTLHRVAPVTRGVRLAAVTWVQSLVRDPARREILFDLDTVRRALHQRDGKSREFDLLAKSVANLLRLWAEV
ncbi:MAG: Fe2+-dependent dioxygenase [Pseudomonadota bacterium]|nr:Fe2+-dependent dioxygenase [Pseudomonadota bacterium]